MRPTQEQPAPRSLELMRHKGCQETKLGGQTANRRFAIKESPQKRREVLRRSRTRSTHRRLRITQEAPVNLGKPLVLLHFRSTTLAAQSSRFPFIQETRDDILAGSDYSWARRG